MSRNYKIYNPRGIYFISFATVGWVDVFTRPRYKEILIDSLAWCQGNKGLIIHGWCIMTSHVHLIISTESIEEKALSRTIGSLKTFTSQQLLAEIKGGADESRREWMMALFKAAGAANSNNVTHQFWQQHNKPIELWSRGVMMQKLIYIHQNPVVEGFCESAIHYLYSSAIDYAGGQGKLKLALLY
jgi:REP element-mobilizing transposase RayT